MILKLCLAASLFGGFSNRDFTTIERDVAPKVSYAIDDNKIEVRAENPYARANGVLRMARGENVQEFQIKKFPFSVSHAKKVAGKGPIKMGLEVRWFDKSNRLVDRRVYFSPSEGGTLPQNARRLGTFDLAAHKQKFADKLSAIYLPYEQEEDGVTTIAISDKDGRRVRNLISAKELKAGEDSVEWDGRDEMGRVVQPGEYTFKGLTHKGLKGEFLFQWYNGDEPTPFTWAANHSMMTALAPWKDGMFVGARLTEGGNMLVALDANGKLAKEFRQEHWRGSDFISIAADDKYLYVVMQGHTFNIQPDIRPRLAFLKYDIDTCQLVPIDKQRSHMLYDSKIDLEEYKKYVAGNMWDNYPQKQFLRGIAVFNGRIYIANDESNCVMVLNPETAKIERSFALDKPSAPLVADGKLYIASGNAVGELNGETGAWKKCFDTGYRPRSISYRNGEWAIIGHADSTVKIYDKGGRQIDAIGEPGGAYAGAWREKRLVAPWDVRFANDGTIWTTEKRTNPKRVVRWSRNGEILYSKYGVPGYGAPCMGFDTEDATRVFANGVEWKVNYETKKVEPVNIGLKDPEPEGNLHYHFTQYRGKKYLVGAERPLRVYEYLPSGEWKRVMAISESVAAFNLCEPFMKFSDKNYPNLPEAKNVPFKKSTRGVFWLDRNGNGEYDEEEFEFLPVKNHSRSDFSRDMVGLTLSYPERDGNNPTKIVTFEPDGFLPNGVLNYDAKRAYAEAKEFTGEIPVGGGELSGSANYTDFRGNLIVNTGPLMFSVTRDGDLNWFYANRWKGVHGSHNAPAYEKGKLIGTIFSMGVAPLDKEGDVQAFMTNTGLVNIMTTDGLFVDDVFHDGRAYMMMDFENFGGEPFGGCFEYDKKTKRYMLQGGHGGYRMYTIKGFENIKRFTGKFSITAEQIASAQRRNPPETIVTQKDVWADVPRVAGTSFNNMGEICKWSAGTVGCVMRGCYDNSNIILAYEVKGDNSPWVNNGKDWRLLFKTGDSVDFRLATDKTGTDKKRGGPIEGDFRLIIAPFEGKTEAVLYRYKVAKKDDSLNPVDYSSPWRTYRVDDVRRIKLHYSQVNKSTDGYKLYVQIPLKELGLTAEKLDGKHKGDFGVIFGDSAGKINLIRSSWADKQTGLVNDIPGEIIPATQNWGKLTFGEKK